MGASSTVTSLFCARADVLPGARALEDAGRALPYSALRDRVSRLATYLVSRGIGAGDRVAILSRNRGEYLEVVLACGWIGAIAACQSWRAADPELVHCLDLVRPSLLVVSEAEAPRIAARAEPKLELGVSYEAVLAASAPSPRPHPIDPESPLLILYTSGTTGLPKGAVISHRAQIVRNLTTRAELGLAATDAYVCWSPLHHMGGIEYSLGTLMSGGVVLVVDGFDPAAVAEHVRREELGWLLLMPGMVGRFADHLEAAGIRPRRVRLCGVMADLVPPADIARVTRLLGAPYANTFGATETGNPPASAGVVPIGALPDRLSKTQSLACDVRLVSEDGEDVVPGTPGELWIRGPTLFSGYWGSDGSELRDGWFAMGDVFVRNPDGTLDFVDRHKYLIKSGGENVYPAEIERVLLADPRVTEAAVVRKKDARWGEVPVAFVARRDDSLDEATLLGAVRAALAGYKRPRELRFLPYDAFPRSASGKVLRHELERRLAAETDPSTHDGTARLA